MQFLQLIKEMHTILKRLEEAVITIRPEESEFNTVMRYGLEGFKDRILKLVKEKQEFNPVMWIIGVIQNEPSIRFPHRKILEYLARQYDYEKSRFKGVNITRIVKECRLGPNRARGYVDFLLNKGLLSEQTDGHKVLYFIKRTTTDR